MYDIKLGIYIMDTRDLEHTPRDMDNALSHGFSFIGVENYQDITNSLFF